LTVTVRLPTIMRSNAGGQAEVSAQGDTIEVVHTLRPLIVVMAGADQFDPYRD